MRLGDTRIQFERAAVFGERLVQPAQLTVGVPEIVAPLRECRGDPHRLHAALQRGLVPAGRAKEIP